MIEWQVINGSTAMPVCIFFIIKAMYAYVYEVKGVGIYIIMNETVSRETVSRKLPKVAQKSPQFSL